ncbi:(Fe-S)-binding protein [Lysobacter silvisoli]|nr:(Fe-S)-binding protein [Lysobacter silvisoli]
MSAARPPTADPLVALADQCVQCGLCLTACPTYGRERIESESPRGRIALARAWALGTVPPTEPADAHLDHCLGCRSCEAVCPAGVRYGELLTLARGHQRERRAPSRRQRWAEALAARPAALGALLRFYRLAYPALPQAWRALPRPPSARAAAATPAPPPAPRGRVALFAGCVANVYENELRTAVAGLCAHLGYAVDTSTRDTCCGSLHAHAGDLVRATALGQTTRAAYAGADTVLTLASGCHESVAHALDGQARTQDAIAFLDAQAPQLRLRARRERVALHLPCTQRNVVGSVPALRRLLARVPELEVVELRAGQGCCGAAGTQMLTDAARAADFRAPLLREFAASGATRLLSANIGCRLHLGAALTAPVQHPLQFLAELAQPAAATPAANGATT